EEYKACKSWFSDLLQWIEKSEQGQRAIAAKNNIGFWTDLQRLIYAQFSGRSDLIGSILTESVIQKINQQIDEEGRLINELSRAQPYDYVAFTLLAMAGLSAASRNGDIQLGEYSTEEGR